MTLTAPHRLVLTIIALHLLPASTVGQEEVDTVVSEALARSPEVALAEAEVQKALANLVQVRNEVITKVLVARHERARLHQRLERAAQQAKTIRQRHLAGHISVTELEAAEMEVADLQTEIANLEARDLLMSQQKSGVPVLGGLPLLGRLFRNRAEPVSGLDNVTPSSAPEEATQSRRNPPPIPPRIAKGLEVPLQFGDEIRSSKEFWKLLKAATEVDFLIDQRLRGEYDSDEPLAFSLRGEHSLRDVLHALADEHEWTFVVRPYGLFVTDRGSASGYDAVCIP